MEWIKTIFDPRHAVRKADRLRFHQRRRSVLGLTIDPGLTHVTGCLLEGLGAGKLLRPLPRVFERSVISESTRRLYRETFGPLQSIPRLDTLSDWSAFVSLQTDITQLATELVGRLMAHAGEATDKILAASIHHPGIWITDLASSRDEQSTVPLIDANRLALSTGLNILDQYCVKDRCEGGTGWPISALPLWLLWADRRSPQAFEHRVLVELTQEGYVTWLPPSDGLDATYPLIEQSCLDPRPVSHDLDASPSADAPALTESLVAQIQAALERWSVKPKRFDASVPFPPYHKIRLILSGESRLVPEVCSRLTQVFPDTNVVLAEDYHCPPWSMSSIVAGIHGFLHIDQVPSNLPWISGTDVPRILGALTPGSACRYRHLLIEMSDYRPPAMTLREAV